MSISTEGWSNKGCTSGRWCRCGTWKQHWVTETKKPWPIKCSVYGCNGIAEHGGHLVNKDEDGEWIAPICASCNGRSPKDVFSLKPDTPLYSANVSRTCGK